MKQLNFLLCLSFMACQSTKGIHRASALQRDGYLKTTATTVQMSRCCTHDSVKIHYIGCGGYLIRRGNDAVLIDPYFSNASLSSMQSLRTDSALVATFFYENFNNTRDISLKNAKNSKNTEGVSQQISNIQNDDLAAQNVIKAIVMSHAHHDHLADLPYIFQHNLSSPHRTMFLGSQTASNILRAFKTPFDPTHSFFNLDSIFTEKHRLNDTTPVRWTSDNQNLRITAIEGEHAPHFYGIKIPFIGGQVLSVPKRYPRSTFGFKEGKNYNFLIDFLAENGDIHFRIYTHGGSASRATIGFLPPSVLGEKKVDFLILCGANYDQAVQYPEVLLQHIKPERVLVGHWEDFFTPISTLLKTPRTVRFTNIPKLVKIVKAEMLKNNNPTDPMLLQPLTPLVVRF
jgi:glyoxylase-like metal-dependent hydrolase (beta-lactamase superfamily II)